MKYLFLLLLINSTALFAQKKGDSDSVSKIINSLNWKSFTIAYSYFSSFRVSNEVEDLIRSCDKNCKLTLVGNICDESKTVIIHIILSRLYLLSDTSLTGSFNYKNDSIGNRVDKVTYTYNSLSWNYDVESGVYSINKEEISMIKKYWESKLLLSEKITPASIKKQSKKCDKKNKRSSFLP